jgi:hypothetical protein
MSEIAQGLETRTPYFAQIEKMLGIPVITFFTSFRFPVSLEDSDVDMLAGFLQMLDLSKGFALMINSPGGDGVAAERMINVCRNYSGTGEYVVIVPGKAKSAATMVCLGASKIYMGPTSELGPIDPQLPILDENGRYTWIAAYHVVQTYKQLFKEAVETSGHIEPYIQQLGRYKAAQISEYEASIALSKDIAIAALEIGMLKGCKNREEIEKNIKVFITPEDTKVHGRPIYKETASKCGLNIEAIDAQSDLWKAVYELYVRTDNYVMSHVSKCFENGQRQFISPIPEEVRNV